MLKVLVVLLVCVGYVMSRKARFDNYAVYRVQPNSETELAELQMLFKRPDGLTFWGMPRRVGDTLEVMVPPHKLPDFSDFLTKTNIENRVFIENLQDAIDTENPKEERNELFGWTSYGNLTEIYEWLDSVAEEHPEATTVVGGESFEGREIKGVKVTYKEGNPIIFIEAGIHAREWIAPATATYVLNEVLTNKDPEVRKIVEAFNWFVFPSCNPDGYEYTHTTNRLWRKTRSDHGLDCRGVDPNRNWGFHWMDGGSSNDSCSIFFAGPSAFSEKETESLSKFIETVGSKITVYLAFHSYSQILLFPYGHTPEKIRNYDQVVEIGQRAADKMTEKHETHYRVGNIYENFYVASGSSMDWVRGTIGVPITFGVELRDKGQYGFVLPANQIIPSGEEVFDGILSILKDSKDIDRAKPGTDD